MRRPARSSLVMVALAGAGLLASGRASAQAPLRQVIGLPNGQPYGVGQLANQDYDSQSVSIVQIFGDRGLHVDDTYYAAFNVEIDGDVSSGIPMAGIYTFPDPSAPRFAVWFGDGDLTGTTTTQGPGVFWHVGPLDVNAGGPNVFMVTWFQLGYSQGHRDKLNSFQLILTSRIDLAVGDFDAEFRYNQCEWTTGDGQRGDAGLGGIPASAGYDFSGLPMMQFGTWLPPGSDILQLCTTSNVGEPGVWRIAGRNGVIHECTPLGCDPPDGGVADAGEPDAGIFDAGEFDTGAPDTGVFDAGLFDAGVFDAGVSDAPAESGVADGSIAHIDHYAGGGFCSCRTVGSTSGRASGAGLMGLLVAAVGLSRRRRR